VFKGGTSLSKVFGAINRFSEDIDLSIAPELLGWKESELDDAPTPTQRRKRLETDLSNRAPPPFPQFGSTVCAGSVNWPCGRPPAPGRRRHHA
jgi:hypothetical protein